MPQTLGPTVNYTQENTYRRKTAILIVTASEDHSRSSLNVVKLLFIRKFTGILCLEIINTKHKRF